MEKNMMAEEFDIETLREYIETMKEASEIDEKDSISQINESSDSVSSKIRKKDKIKEKYLNKRKDIKDVLSSIDRVEKLPAEIDKVKSARYIIEQTNVKDAIQTISLVQAEKIKEQKEIYEAVDNGKVFEKLKGQTSTVALYGSEDGIEIVPLSSPDSVKQITRSPQLFSTVEALYQGTMKNVKEAAKEFDPYSEYEQTKSKYPKEQDLSEEEKNEREVALAGEDFQDLLDLEEFDSIELPESEDKEMNRKNKKYIKDRKKRAKSINKMKVNYKKLANVNGSLEAIEQAELFLETDSVLDLASKEKIKESLEKQKEIEVKKQEKIHKKVQKKEERSGLTDFKKNKEKYMGILTVKRNIEKAKESKEQKADKNSTLYDRVLEVQDDKSKARIENDRHAIVKGVDENRELQELLGQEMGTVKSLEEYMTEEQKKLDDMMLNDVNSKILTKKGKTVSLLASSEETKQMTNTNISKDLEGLTNTSKEQSDIINDMEEKENPALENIDVPE